MKKDGPEQHEASLRPKPFEFSETLPTGEQIIVPRHEPFDYGYGIGQQLVNKGVERIRRVMYNGQE
jgi:hypothetical protein